MDLPGTLLLGLIAGATIVLGLPLGRLRRPAGSVRVLLTSSSIGILLFLVWDVLSAAWEPIDSGLASMHDGHGGADRVLGYGTLFAVGLAVGLLGLVRYESWMRSRALPTRRPAGPGAMAVSEASGLASLSPARHLALLIAGGIGLHNFAEGLAIGQAAASGAIGLATLLVIGFGLHNATEGFGIIAPLAADADEPRPTWTFLGLLGLIGGGPTFLGAALGHSFTSEPVSVAFLTLAAGSIIYVVTQLVTVAAKSRRSDLLAIGILVGLLAGFATDAVLTAAGV